MERAIPILPSHDLAAAKVFYVDGLGFRVTFEASADGRTGLVGLQRGTIELTLDCPMESHGRNACVSLHVAESPPVMKADQLLAPALFGGRGTRGRLERCLAPGRRDWTVSIPPLAVRRPDVKGDPA
jgi:hypothetical protein